MPETPFTEYCNHALQLIKDVAEFGIKKVQPAMFALRDDKARTDVKRDTAIVGTYIRIPLWLRSLGRLNETFDAQAVATGARTLFELYLDLVWLEKHPQPEWPERYHAFSDIDRYLAAEKVVEHKKKFPTSTIDIAPYQGWMDRVEKVNPNETIDARILRIWGPDKKGNPAWPLFHWTGVRQLSERAEQLGVEYLDIYRQTYPVLSWLVHAGPTAYYGLNFTELEMRLGHAYIQASRFAYSSTTLACTLLGIRDKIEGYDDFLRDFLSWVNEAYSKLPK